MATVVLDTLSSGQVGRAVGISTEIRQRLHLLGALAALGYCRIHGDLLPICHVSQHLGIGETAARLTPRS